MSRVAVAVVIVVAAISTPAAMATPQAQERPSLQTPAGFETTTFRITVHGNGSATWAIEHRQPLTNDSQREQFRAFADRFETTETDLFRTFKTGATRLADLGSSATDREMAARNIRRSAAIDPAQSQGTVRMAFLWTNFTARSGDQYIISDVFEGGFYIGEGQSLVIERNESLRFASVRPPPDSQSEPDSIAASRSVTWVGERSFNDSRPYIALESDDAGNGGSGQMWALLIVVVLLGLSGGLAWRSGAVSVSAGSGAETATSSADDAVSHSDDDGIDPELLADDDRVLKLLEGNGGRMKQVEIVDATEWSKAKVSMLLSEMDEDGEISKLRVGRENIISIAGEEPDIAGSPLDDE
jgi:uncharacterized membrane protein